MHLRNDHPECPQCNGLFTNKNDLYVHLTRVHSRCDNCCKWFRNQASLGQHISERVQCLTCSTTHCSQALLEVHRYANPANLIKCYDCEIWFSDADTLVEHESRTHPTCDGCQMRFKVYDEYLHHATNWYKCELCPNEIWLCRKSKLGTHRTEARHVKCSFCHEKWFIDDVQYTEHKEKLHQKCSTCSSRYSTTISLRKHRRHCSGRY